MSKDKDKKDRRSPRQLPQQQVPSQGISQTGKKVIAAGIGILVLGFYVLSLTDPAGQNWASHVSPFLILGAYTIIGVGIILPDRPPKESSTLPPPQNVTKT